nr:MAG TPA: hypothetical protein [Caudoviricetes sp.]
MVDILIGVLLLGVGGMAGWFLRKAVERRTHKAEVQTASEKELIRLKEDKEAFDVLMGYNIDMAYGIDKKE